MTRLSSGAKIIGGRYFNFKTGPILPECIFIKSLRYFGNTGNRNIHSRHIGGVTLLFKAGVPQHIQKIGRWTSDAYNKHGRLTAEHVHTAYDSFSQFM